MKTYPPNSEPSKRGFSLIEILVVIGISSVMLVLGVNAFGMISQATALTRAGQDISFTLQMARQNAVSRNRVAEVRIFQLPASAGTALGYRGIQVWMAKDDHSALQPLTKMLNLPTGVVIGTSGGISPLVDTAPAGSGKVTIGGTQRDYRAFALRADGSLKGLTNGSSSYFTLVRELDAASAAVPANFSAVHINPVTGEVTIFRP